MKCSCGADAYFRVIVTIPANLPDTPAKEKGCSWVMLCCANCLPFTLRGGPMEKKA